MHKQLEKGILLQGTKFGYLKTTKKGELIVDESVRETITNIFDLYEPVSYTHLAVYKRQKYNFNTWS